MVKNLLLVALRNFKRDKWYRLLNILGLTIGTKFSLFLIFYIKDELSYDRFTIYTFCFGCITALLTVIFHTLKAALANPVRSLRIE